MRKAFLSNPSFNALYMLFSGIRNELDMDSLEEEVTQCLLDNPEFADRLSHLNLLADSSMPLKKDLREYVQAIGRLKPSEETIRAFMEHPCARGDYQEIYDAFAKLRSPKEAEHLLRGMLSGDDVVTNEALEHLEKKFLRHSTALIEKFRGTELEQRTNRYPNFGLRGDRNDSNFVYPHGIMPMQQNPYEGSDSWEERIMAGYPPKLSR